MVDRIDNLAAAAEVLKQLYQPSAVSVRVFVIKPQEYLRVGVSEFIYALFDIADHKHISARF